MPKQKAKELVKKFTPIFKDLYLEEYILKMAKKCALVSVEDMITELRELDHTISVIWWKKVKQEIEKL